MVNFNALTADNGAIRSLSELMFATTYKDSDLATLVNLKTGQKNGGKMDWLNLYAASPQGLKGGGCSPEWGSLPLTGLEKTWAMGKYHIALEICSDVFDNTIAEYAKNKGTAVNDLRGTEITSEVIMPVVDRALRLAIMRLAWFGDTNADTFTNGGHITNTVNLDLINVTDGLFVKIADVVANSPKQLTAIAANTALDGNNTITYASQQAAIDVAGAALKVFNDVYRAADARIKQNGGVFYCTQMLFDAFQLDYERQHNSTIPYETVADGRIIATFRGHKIVVVPEWDACIDAFENNGTAWHNPFRLLFTPRENLFVGTTNDDVMANIDLDFDTRTQTNLLYVESDLATNVGEDSMFQVAY